MKYIKIIGFIVVCYLLSKLMGYFFIDQIIDIKRNNMGMLDDHLYIILTQSILNGNWLGAYDWAILTANPVYPIILSLGRLIRLNPSELNFFLYFICLIFCIRKDLSKLGITIVLIIYLFSGWVIFFNGLLFSTFRDESIAIFVLMYALYIQKNRSYNYYLDALLLSIIFFYREEMAFILAPYLFLKLYFIFRNTSFFKAIQYSLLFSILPLSIIFLNGYYYGAYVLNDRAYGPNAELLFYSYKINIDEKKPVVVTTLRERQILQSKSEAFKLLGAPFVNRSWWVTCDDPEQDYMVIDCNISYSQYDTFLRDVLRYNGFFNLNYIETKNKFIELNENLRALCEDKLINCERNAFNFDKIFNIPYFNQALINSINFAIEKKYYYTNPENKIINFNSTENSVGFIGANGNKDYVGFFRGKFSYWSLRFFLLLGLLIPILLIVAIISKNFKCLEFLFFPTSIIYGKILVIFMLFPMWEVLGAKRQAIGFIAICAACTLAIIFFYLNKIKFLRNLKHD